MYFLIDIDFLTTCPGTYYFLLANQIVHLTIHYPIKIFAIKAKVKLKFVESINQHLENEMISALNPHKFDRKIQKCLEIQYRIL